MGMLTREQLDAMGFAHIGKDVCISDKASFYNCANIHIGDYSRIDDFCVLSAGRGGIHIGRNVHIAVFCSLLGQGKIELLDFAGLSSRVSLYSSSDDYSGKSMTNPTVPAEFTNVVHGDIQVGRHVIIGAGTIVLPGITIGEGSAIGALSLVTKHCDTFSIYSGSPAKRIKSRRRDLLDIEKAFLAKDQNR